MSWEFWATDMNGKWYRSTEEPYSDEEVVKDLSYRLAVGYDIFLYPRQPTFWMMYFGTRLGTRDLGPFQWRKERP